jgi:hypothetical protein
MMRPFRGPRFRRKAALVAVALAGGATAVAATAEEAPFLAENDAAMAKMMAAMAINPSGDADRDFVAMMVPHHQGAIDMAQAELRYGRNEQLRRLAQEIIVTQQQEIAAMRLAVDGPPPPSVSSPDPPSSGASTEAPPSPHHSMPMQREP